MRSIDYLLQITLFIEYLDLVGTPIADVNQTVNGNSQAVGQFNSVIVGAPMQAPLALKASIGIEYSNSRVAARELAICDINLTSTFIYIY
jgi:hypothetical protein